MNCWARSLQSWVGGHGLLSAAYKRQSRKREKKRTEKGESAGSLLSSCTTLGLRRRLFSPATVDALMAKFWLQGRLGCRGGGTGQKLFLFFHPALLSLSLSVRFLRGRRRDYKHARDAEASVGCHPISFQRIQIRVYTGAGEKTNQRAALVVLVATRVNFRLIVSTIVLYRPSFSIMQRSNNHRLP